MSMVALQKHKIPSGIGNCTYTPIAKSLPFVYSRNGEYTYRVRSAVIIKLANWPAHVVYRCWCGMTLLHGNLKLAKLSEDNVGRPICATCEGRAVGAGLTESREIGGREVMFRPRK